VEARFNHIDVLVDGTAGAIAAIQVNGAIVPQTDRSQIDRALGEPS
jgi:hypothetical protein